MRVVKIAVMGAPDTGLAQLFEALTVDLKVYSCPISVVMADLATLNDCDLTLLMGLSPLQSPEIAASDHELRLALAHTGTAYEVLYGTTQERLAQTLKLVEQRLARPSTAFITPQLQTETKHGQWVWLCEKCSDPQCEHKLLTQLLVQRTTAP